MSYLTDGLSSLPNGGNYYDALKSIGPGSIMAGDYGQDTPTPFSALTPLTPGGYSLTQSTPNQAALIDPAAAAAIPGATDSGWLGALGKWFKDSGFLGSTDIKTRVRTDGWGAPLLSSIQGLGNAYLGMQQYGLAKKALAQKQREFALNYDAQKRTTNAALEDRQRARLAANPGAYQSVGDYMNKNGIR